MAKSDASSLHPATPRKRQRARAEGRVAKSADLTSAMVLLGGLATLILFGERWWNAAITIMQNRLENPVWSHLSIEAIQAMTNDALSLIVLILIPATGFLIGLPLMVHLLQTRFLLHISGVMPDFSRLGMTGWIHRTWAQEGAARLVFGLSKLLLLIAIAIWFCAKRGSDLVSLARLPIPELAPSLGGLLLQVTLEFTAVLLALATFDFFYQRRRYENQLMMTAEEIREESQNR
ncbi:MAG: EscU/YscU/HrcU family type III secretion system export apparatus switch protein [Planctomycetota bacterium]|nr:EscU/YscU/HrcU family type III secretion system export apparatus switch protein [Planctomycetota bacterium]